MVRLGHPTAIGLLDPYPSIRAFIRVPPVVGVGSRVHEGVLLPLLASGRVGRSRVLLGALGGRRVLLVVGVLVHA